MLNDMTNETAQLAIEQIRIHWSDTAVAAMAPHVLMRPRIAIDGNKWGALYGDNLQDGVAGFGDSPAEAMADFDRNWHAKLSVMRENSG